MSYGIIKKCFGLDLHLDGNKLTKATLISLFRDIAKIDHGDSVDNWSEEEVFEWTGEFDGVSYGWGGYSSWDENDGAMAIGFQITQWPYWELNGPGGIIVSAQDNNTTPELLAKWNKLVSQAVRVVLTKHGIAPGVFWTTSTS